MSFLAAAAIGAGIGAAGNLLGSASQSAMGYYMSKKMAKYNYDLQKKGYQEFPAAQVSGLRAAGINPMVAYGGIAGAQAHAGNYQAAPGSDLGSSAVNNYRENKKLDPALKNLQADTKAKVAQGNAAEAQAGAAAMQGKAALINAMNSSKRVDAEVKLMEKQGSSLDVRNPNESAWGVVDRIVGAAGNVGTTLGGTALAAKTMSDIVKNKELKPYLYTDSNGNLFKYHPKYGLSEPYTPPPSPSKKPSVFSRAINSAKKVFPWLVPAAVIGSKALGAAGLTYGAIKAGEKAKETIKKDKKSDYNQGHKYRVPNSFGIPTYW